MASETWRVVLADGDIESVSAWRTDDGTMVRWDREIVHTHTTNVRRGVCMAIEGHDLAIVEILAPGELTRAELRAQVEAYAAQLAPMARVVDVLRAAAVAAGHPAADGDPDAQLRAVRAQAFREGAETMRGAVVQDPHMILSDYDEARIRALPVPPCPEVSR